MASRRKQPDKRNVVKGMALNHSAAIEMRYAAELERMVRQMTTTVKREVLALFESGTAAEHFGQDANISAQAKILMSALSKQFLAMFTRRAKFLASRMLDAANKESEANVNRSLKAISQTVTVNAAKAIKPVQTVVTASVAENVSLIKTIPQEYLAGVQQAVMRSITTGNGIQDLKPYIEKHDGITERRARLIANDQTRKAYNNINKARMQASGVRKFEWLHSAGGRDPRELHITPYPAGLNGGIFSFNDLPIIDERTGERGIPGTAISCRCRMIPLLDLGDDDGQ